MKNEFLIIRCSSDLKAILKSLSSRKKKTMSAVVTELIKKENDSSKK